MMTATRATGYFYCVRCEWIGQGRAWPGPRNCGECNVAAKWQATPGPTVQDVIDESWARADDHVVEP